MRQSHARRVRDGVRERRLRTAVALPLLALALVGAAPPSTPTTGQGPQDLGAVEMVLDASGSMRRPDSEGRPRIDSAQQAIVAVVSELPGDVPLGLRVFGAGPALRADPATCSDSQLVVPVEPGSAPAVVDGVLDVAPQGWTPIGYALETAAGDLEGSSDSFGTVVLVSDGVDECYPAFGPEPCDVARSMTDGPIQLRVHTVGLVVDDAARRQLQCIAEVTGGRYADASDTDGLAEALRNSLLPPPPVPDGPPEPPPPDLVRTLALALLLAGGSIASMLLIRRGIARRRRSYW